MARKPTVGGDGDNWGSILNGFLDVAHNSDGSLKLIDDSAVMTFNVDGSISQVFTPSDITLTTVFNADGSITETYSGGLSRIRTTTINSDGSISVAVS